MKIITTFWPLLLVVTNVICLKQGLNIAVHSGFGGRSHVKSILNYSEKLIERGHKVTYVGVDENMKYIAGYQGMKNYSIGESILSEEEVYTMAYNTVLKEGIEYDPLEGIVLRFSPILEGSFKTMYRSLKSYLIESKPDLIICDFFSVPCLMLAREIGIPLVVSIQSTDIAEFTNMPYITKSLSYGPITMDELTYFERFCQLVVDPIHNIFKVLPLINSIKKVESEYKVNIGMKLFGDTIYPIILGNTFTGFEPALPLQPNLFQVGPILSYKNKEIESEELINYLRDHKYILYIGFGSFSVLNKELIERILTSSILLLNEKSIDGIVWGLGKTKSSEFPAEIIINNETIQTESFFNNQHQHIKILSWAPQPELLNHNHVKIFLSHSGMESMIESVSSSTKILCLPLFGDQFRNAYKIVSNKLGLHLDKMDFTSSDFIDKANTLLNDSNQEFKNNINKFNAMMQYYSKRLDYAATLIESHGYLAKSCRPFEAFDPKLDLPPCETKHLIPVSYKMGFIRAYGLDIYILFILVLDLNLSVNKENMQSLINRLRLKTDTPWSKSSNSVIFICISFIQGAVVIALEGILYFQIISSKNDTDEGFTNDDKVEALQSYLIIFIVSQVFQVVISMESVFFKNTLQIFGLILFNIMSFVYSIFQYFQYQNIAEIYKDNDYFFDRLEMIKKVVISVASIIAICQVALAYSGFKCYQEFGWDIYRKTGSDLTMRRYYMLYHLLLMFLKFDVFFFFGFTYQFLCLYLNIKDYEYPLTIASVPLAVIILLVAIISVQRENSILCYVSLFGLTSGVAYFIFKIYRIYTKKEYNSFRNFMSLFCFISLIFILITIGLIIQCYRNFGKGLGKYIRVTFSSNNTIQNRTSLNLCDD
ncbi:UDP-Glycosyltransferase/glycogen phosphorylase [Neoconidiobolus thromboides FSU 785]|nr:UDP-Glycosyltransferase/glycogen phosphorylase [Neoconidiobolus thromboides FSU 785]